MSTKKPKEPLKLTPLDEMGKLLARVAIAPKPEAEPKAKSSEKAS